jgi:hypothetical protein
MDMEMDMEKAISAAAAAAAVAGIYNLDPIYSMPILSTIRPPNCRAQATRSENCAVSLLSCKALAVPGSTLPAGLGEESRALGILVHYGDGTREKHGIPLGLRFAARR